MRRGVHVVDTSRMETLNPELRAAFRIPAVWANRLAAIPMGHGIRLVFGEGDDNVTDYHTAILTSREGIEKFRDTLTNLLLLSQDAPKQPSSK